MFPLIPLALGALAGLSATGLYWYYQLSREEQKEADRKAMEYARNLYDKGLNELTKQQLAHVHNLTKQHFS